MKLVTDEPTKWERFWISAYRWSFASLPILSVVVMAVAIYRRDWSGMCAWIIAIAITTRTARNVWEETKQ